MECTERLRRVLQVYMGRVAGIGEFCDRCLRTERWGGNVVLMVVDAAFTSIGLNYFTAVVPKVLEFKKRFVDSGDIVGLRDLADADVERLREIWRNRRSWHVARAVAKTLTEYSSDDREALRRWAASSNLENWRQNPVGRIKGVGIITYQYLRMMGGVDTVMPDKIVKKVINQIFVEAGLEPIWTDMEFVYAVEDIARKCGYRPIEVCWMTWLIQEEGRMIRMEKYRGIMKLI